jgi:DNA-binding NtrC family response regulator
MPRILVVEDNPIMAAPLSEYLHEVDYSVQVVNSLAEAKEIISQERFNGIVLDHALNNAEVNNPDLNGPGLVKFMKMNDIKTPVVVYTSWNINDIATQYPPESVSFFLAKTSGPANLKNHLDKIIERIDVADTQIRKKELGKTLDDSKEQMIGSSQVMQELRRIIKQYAPYDHEPVLIYGENGTGKELVANMLHQHSNRYKKPIYDVNCAALPRELLVRELFGHMKGAFTSADKDMPGAFENASDSSLFLDEIGELPIDGQVSLLRALQERYIKRLGGKKNIEINARIIFATNNDLVARVANRTFREDLYHRMNSLVLRVPPLRDRKEDIPELTDHFVKKFSENYKFANPQVHNSALARMAEYHWPGNVRELENFIKRALILNDQVLDAGCLDKYLVI